MLEKKVQVKSLGFVFIILDPIERSTEWCMGVIILRKRGGIQPSGNEAGNGANKRPSGERRGVNSQMG